MQVIRKIAFETNKICVGDQITINLDGFGKFTATAQKVTDEGILFLFDKVIAEHSMNESETNKGGFEQSDMKRWLYDTVLPAFPEKLRCKVKDIALPTYEQIFGHSDNYFYINIEPNKNEQFELMKQRDNRICCEKDQGRWWWLQNAVNLKICEQDLCTNGFVFVNSSGYAALSKASTTLWVRPCFLLNVQE